MEDIDKRIVVFSRFFELFDDWEKMYFDESWVVINRVKWSVEWEVIEVGCLYILIILFFFVVGGMIMCDVNLFNMIFE